MGEELKAGCARPTGGPVGEPLPEETTEEITVMKEAPKMIKVGQKAPDFTAPGYQQGKKVLKPGPDLVGNVWKEWKTDMAFD